MALLLWLCNYRFWSAALYTELASLKVRTEHEMVTTSTGLMESFWIKCFGIFFLKWKSGSVSLKEGLFDLMSLCDRNMKQYVSVCAELEQTIFLRNNV